MINEKDIERAYTAKCMDIVKEIMEFADEQGKNRKDCFIIIAKMLKGVSERAPEDILNRL